MRRQLVGYKGDSIYRIYLPAKHTIIRTSHVSFNENDIELPNVKDSLEDESMVEHVSLPLSSEGKALLDIA